MTPASPEVARQVPFGPGWHHFGSGFNEPNGDHLCMSRRVTCVAGKGRLPPVAGHMTPADRKWSRDTCLPQNRKWGQVT